MPKRSVKSNRKTKRSVKSNRKTKRSVKKSNRKTKRSVKKSNRKTKRSVKGGDPELLGLSALAIGKSLLGIKRGISNSLGEKCRQGTFTCNEGLECKDPNINGIGEKGICIPIHGIDKYLLKHPRHYERKINTKLFDRYTKLYSNDKETLLDFNKKKSITLKNPLFQLNKSNIP